MTEKYRKAVYKPIKFMNARIKKIAKKDAPTKTKKFLKVSALVGLGLVDLVMMLTRLIAFDNAAMRLLEKKLSEIDVGKDKQGRDKKIPSLVKNNPNVSAFIIWWAMLAGMIGIGSAIVNAFDDKDIDDIKRQEEKVKKRSGTDEKTVSFEVAKKQAQIKKKLDKKIKMTNDNVVKQAMLDNFAYIQAVLFSTENYRTDWFCDYKTGNANTLGVGLFYLPDAEHSYDFTSTSWARTSQMYKKYPKNKSGKPRNLTDDEVYDGIKGWFFYMDGGRNFKRGMCDILGKSNIYLTPRDLTVISSVTFNSLQCGKKFCEFIVAHPNNRRAWAKYLLQVDDVVSANRLNNFPGLKSRRVHEILLLLDVDNYCSDMFCVQIDGHHSSAVSYANNYFDKLKINFAESVLVQAKSAICNGVVANGFNVCEAVQKSEKYRDDVFAYCADVDSFLYADKSRQKIYDEALESYRDKDYETALRGFNKVVEMGGVSPDLFNDLAITYIHYEDYDMSIKMSKRALNFGNKKTMAASYFNLGLAYEKKGDTKKAKIYYSKAVELGNKFAQKKLDNLQEEETKKKSNAVADMYRKQMNTSGFAKRLFVKDKNYV